MLLGQYGGDSLTAIFYSRVHRSSPRLSWPMRIAKEYDCKIVGFSSQDQAS